LWSRWFYYKFVNNTKNIIKDKLKFIWYIVSSCNEHTNYDC